MYARLVDDHVRELGKAVFDVLHASSTSNVRGIVFVWFPECRLVDPARLLGNTFSKAKRFEHLHRATGDPVRLPQRDWPFLLFDYARVDVRECTQLSGQRETGWPTADDQYVNTISCRLVQGGRGSVLQWIPCPKTIQVKLHVPLVIDYGWLTGIVLGRAGRLRNATKANAKTLSMALTANA